MVPIVKFKTLGFFLVLGYACYSRKYRWEGIWKDYRPDEKWIYFSRVEEVISGLTIYHADFLSVCIGTDIDMFNVAYQAGLPGICSEIIC